MAGLPHDGTASGDPVPSTSMSAPPLHVVHLGLLTTQVINALYNVLMQYLVSPAVSITPLVFCAYRDVLAWPLLLTACTWTLPRWSSSSSAALSKPYVPSLLLPADKREWPQLALQALLGVFCNQLFFLYGVQLTDATTAAIVNLSLPIFTASLAVCMGVEVPRWRTAAGIALAVAGAAVLKLGAGSSSSPASSSSRSLALNTAGITVLLLGALASAVYLLLQASMLKRHPALLVTTWEYLVGAALVSVAALLYTPLDGLVLSKAALPALVFSVVGNSCMKYFLQALCNKHAGSVVTTVWSTLCPALTAALSVLMLGAELSWSHVGALPVAAGAYLVTAARTSHHDQQR